MNTESYSSQNINTPSSTPYNETMSPQTTNEMVSLENSSKEVTTQSNQSLTTNFLQQTNNSTSNDKEANEQPVKRKSLLCYICLIFSILFAIIYFILDLVFNLKCCGKLTILIINDVILFIIELLNILSFFTVSDTIKAIITFFLPFIVIAGLILRMVLMLTGQPEFGYSDCDNSNSKYLILFIAQVTYSIFELIFGCGVFCVAIKGK